jgi:hypothetical protein
MARIWIVEDERIIFIGYYNQENKTEKEQMLEIHKVIIQAIKEKGEK